MIYADTSALMKRYLLEPASAAFDVFFLEHAPFAISRLTMVEMRCALARRRRVQHITAELETRALEEVRLDMQDGALVIYPFTDDRFSEAYHLLTEVGDIALRTLDALHLAAARHSGASGFATADKTQAVAAKNLGLIIHIF